MMREYFQGCGFGSCNTLSDVTVQAAGQVYHAVWDREKVYIATLLGRQVMVLYFSTGTSYNQYHTIVPTILSTLH